MLRFHLLKGLPLFVTVALASLPPLTVSKMFKQTAFRQKCKHVIILTTTAIIKSNVKLVNRKNYQFRRRTDAERHLRVL